MHQIDDKPADEPSEELYELVASEMSALAVDHAIDYSEGSKDGAVVRRALYNAGRASRDGGAWEGARVLQAELARLRAALESAQADRQCAADDLFAQLRVNESLRAESMRGAVEKLRGKAMVFREAAHYGDAGRRPELIRDAEVAEECADWLSQQSATPQPDH